MSSTTAEPSPADGAAPANPAAKSWQLSVGSIFRSRLGILGVLLATVTGGLILTAIITELMFGGLGPYAGMISYMALPAFFIGGLLLIPLGMYLQRQRALRGDPEKATRFMLDLTDPKHQRLLVFVTGMSVINLALISVLGYQAYHFTEATSFCGTLCHTVMEPEYRAYQRSPHARVDCVECHIGSGASWFVKAKISGLRQVAAVMTGNFSRPIPTPVHNLRPARDTCEQCHWPSVFHGNRPKIFRKYDDETTPEDPTITAVMLHVGGHSKKDDSYSGIHWHVSKDNQVFYRAVDEKRVQIRDVKVVKPDGSEILYVKSDLPEVPADTEWRPMDCVDCHNRPTHVYDTPENAVNRLVTLGLLKTDLPEYHSAALEVIQAEYASQEAAEQGIRDALVNFYKQKHPEVATERLADIEANAKVLFDEAYFYNVYPSLKIQWNTYFSQLGHQNDTGCFRCHTDEHEAETGATISQDCDTCHTLLVEEEKLSEMDSTVKDLLF